MNLNSLSLRRTFAGLALLLLVSATLLAQPSSRSGASMVFDEAASRAILFGGVTPPFIKGEEQAVREYIDETWAWNGRRWIQQFPAQSPGGRTGFVFVWDSFAQRAILFGGLGTGTLPLDDTWEFRNGTWRELDVPNRPGARKYAAGAFDRVRNRTIVYGGFRTEVAVDPKTGKEIRTEVALLDTWEFDGTTWTKTGDDGPELRAGVLVYDGTRDETLLIGMKNDNNTVMYRYSSPGWEAITPEALPICLSGASAVWQPHSGNVFLFGGLCSNGLIAATPFEWNGTEWDSPEEPGNPGRLYGHAMAYDSARGEAILFGGTDYDLAAETNVTYRYRDSKFANAWSLYAPGPRSLFGFTSDPDNAAVWLYGGVRGGNDLWKYAFGQWTQVTATGAPAICSYPVTSWDSDRKVLVLVCSDTSTYEFDGTAWKTFSPDKKPLTSIQASIAYDPNLKKTILYGGWNGNYINETWTWGGAQWTKVDGKKPNYRGLASMFYDPISKKVVLYGGIGRTDREGTIVRFDDTWSFNGKDWSELTSAASPPARYGAAVAFNPADNKVHMFGGSNERVEFIAEHWVWDGSKWSQVSGGRVPPARQNARLAWDPTLQQLVLFGGYAGYYLSDLWVLEGTSWQAVDSESRRRRVVALPPAGTASGDAEPAPSRSRAVSRW